MSELEQADPDEAGPDEADGAEWDAAGTPEAVWRSWEVLAGLPGLDLSGITRVVVVAPHPDDEVLGVGGLLQLAPAVHLVAVTDGEASHPDSTVYTRAGLAAARRAESRAALARLGLAGIGMTRLGQPDGGIEITPLATALGALLRPGDACVATWRGDGHPDHEAVGAAAASACRAGGARLLEYPVWTWHWARPGDRRVPWERARRVALPAAVRARKRYALAAFRTQILALGPRPGDRVVLPPAVLERFHRDMEVVFE